MTAARAAGARGAHLLPVAALLAICGLAYANALSGQFVFDDGESIVRNALLRDLTSYLPGGPGYRAVPNRWVGYLTFALNHRFGGLGVTGYHAVNVLIHAASALLVYALVRLAFRTPRIAGSALAPDARAVAFAAAALFVAHPVQTQAVTYVVQRLTSLATLFYLATVVLYAAWRLRREAGDLAPAALAARYLPVLVSAALAVSTKEIAFTLPAVIVLFEAIFFGSPLERRKLPFLLPVALVALLIPFRLLDLGGTAGQLLASAGGATRVQTELARLDYLRSELPVVAMYLRLLLLPVGQNVDHDVAIARSFLELRVAGSLALLLALAGLAAWLARAPGRPTRPLDPSARLVGFGLAWFLVALATESSVIPIVDLAYEHRLYLPSIGLFVAVATGGGWAARRLVPGRGSRALAGAAAGAALLLAAATHARNRVWADELSLWGDAVAGAPLKRRPHYNLGTALARAHRPEEAAAQFRAAIGIDPSHGESYNNLAVALTELGRTEEAVEVLRRAIRMKPDNAEACYNLGRIFLTSQQRYVDAEGLFRRTLELDPRHAGALANLGASLNGQGRFDESIRILEAAGPVVAAQPEARFNLGVAYVAVGNRRAAAGEVAALRSLSPELAARLVAFSEARGPAE